MSPLLSATAAALFAVAAVNDLRSRRIPNLVTLLLALLGLVRIGSDLVAGGAWLAAAGDLGMAFLVFTLGALAFRFGVLGGGDVKLLAAGSLFFGAVGSGGYLLLTALAGGLLALGFLASCLALPGGSRKARPSLPYAVAIAAGGIAASMMGL